MVAEKAEVILPPSKDEISETPNVNELPISGGAEDGKFDSVSTMADLKERAPDVYRVMMQGIAMNVCSEMRKHQRRFRDILRKNREQA